MTGQGWGVFFGGKQRSAGKTRTKKTHMSDSSKLKCVLEPVVIEPFMVRSPHPATDRQRLGTVLDGCRGTGQSAGDTDGESRTEETGGEELSGKLMYPGILLALATHATAGH